MTKRLPVSVSDGGRLGSSTPSPTATGGHLTRLAIELGAVEFGGYCPVHGEEMHTQGTITGRWAHQIRTEDGRRVLCVAGSELI